MRCKHQTIERQQEVLHSPFDINTHKETFISYLEVVISPEGVVEYAVPSHMEKLLSLYAVQRGISVDEARDETRRTAIDVAFDIMSYLMGVTGYISVWFNGYHASDPPTKEQLEVLKMLFDNGVYSGPCHDTITPEREALKEFMKQQIKFVKERG